MNFLKRIPYWLRGVVIAIAFIAVLYLIFSFSQSSFGCKTILITPPSSGVSGVEVYSCSFLEVRDFFHEIISDAFCSGGGCSIEEAITAAYIWLPLFIIITIGLGAFIGWIYGKSKIKE